MRKLTGDNIAGIAVICGLLTGLASIIVTVFAVATGNLIAAGICLAAAGLSFGLVANATLRQ
jgi:hypothetical protein